MKARDLHIGYGLALACACIAAAPAVADAAETPKPRPTAPPLSGPGSLAGVWNNPEFKAYRTGPPVGQERATPTADGQPIPFRPEVAALLAKRRESARNGKPVAEKAACVPNGMPGMMRPPAELPLEIVESPTKVVVLFEFYGTFRIIYLNAKHRDDPDPTYFGDSVGHWEGKTLVVDTIGVNDKTLVAGAPHGPNLHLVERMKRTGPDTMEDRMTIEDPTAFTRPWTWLISLKKIPGMRIQEYVCENERNAPDANGNTSVELKSSTP